MAITPPGRALARFAHDLSFDTLPEDVVEKAKTLALHSWSIQAACSTLPWSRVCYRAALAESNGGGDATVAGYGDRVTITSAVLTNGTFGHGFELDDNHARTFIKGGCLTVPAALAIGESRGSTGREMITAIVAGYEVMLRIGIASWSGIRRLNFHPTGALGAVGAAVTAGKLLDLDEDQLMHAIGAALVSPVGCTEAPPEGRGDLKRAFAGLAGAAGTRAAQLAELGMTGPETLVEAYLRSTYDVSDPADVPTGLGRTWEIRDVHYKIYAQDGFIQPVTEGLDRIVGRTAPVVDDIAEIRVGTNRHAHDRIIGKIREPRTVTDAQFSVFFSAALFLCTGGAGLGEYTDANLADERIRALSERVQLYVDDELERDYQVRRPRAAKVAVVMQDGTEHHEHIAQLRDITADELETKIRALASANLQSRSVERLLVLAADLDTLADVRAIGEALGGRVEIA